MDFMLNETTPATLLAEVSQFKMSILSSINTCSISQVQDQSFFNSMLEKMEHFPIKISFFFGLCMF